MTDSQFRKREFWIWTLVVIITLVSAVYQRVTGPSYPSRGNVSIGDENVSFKLLRTSTTDIDAPVKIEVHDQNVNGTVEYRRYRSADPWTQIVMQRNQNDLETTLPRQPASGKLMYFVYLEKEGQKVSLTHEIPVILRYKGDVPPWILIPHIIIMFIAILFSNLSAMEVLTKRGHPYLSMLSTIALLFLGGLILGPLVQKYAFGEFWAGIPFGYDLTDNKTLIAMLGWLFAWWKNRKEKNQLGWIVFASILTLAVYLIPHSLFGSELDFTRMPPPSGGR